jgi:hypothetical protein
MIKKIIGRYINGWEDILSAPDRNREITFAMVFQFILAILSAVFVFVAWVLYLVGEEVIQVPLIGTAVHYLFITVNFNKFSFIGKFIKDCKEVAKKDQKKD